MSNVVALKDEIKMGKYDNHFFTIDHAVKDALLNAEQGFEVVAITGAEVVKKVKKVKGKKDVEYDALEVTSSSGDKKKFRKVFVFKKEQASKIKAYITENKSEPPFDKYVKRQEKK